MRPLVLKIWTLTKNLLSLYIVVTLSAGTIYIEQPGSNEVIIRGYGTETTPITSTIASLRLDEGAHVTMESSVTITNLVNTEVTDPACQLVVKSGVTATVTNLGQWL